MADIKKERYKVQAEEKTADKTIQDEAAIRSNKGIPFITTTGKTVVVSIKDNGDGTFEFEFTEVTA